MSHSQSDVSDKSNDLDEGIGDSETDLRPASAQCGHSTDTGTDAGPRTGTEDVGDNHTRPSSSKCGHTSTDAGTAGVGSHKAGVGSHIAIQTYLNDKICQENLDVLPGGDARSDAASEASRVPQEGVDDSHQPQEAMDEGDKSSQDSSWQRHKVTTENWDDKPAVAGCQGDTAGCAPAPPGYMDKGEDEDDQEDMHRYFSASQHVNARTGDRSEYISHSL